MSVKRIYNISAILLGYGLIIGGFVVFGESIEDNVKILDIIVSCLIFTQFVQFTIFRLVNLIKSAHKEVGMMGIHFATLNICSTLSVGLMTYGIVYSLSFKLQLIGQLAILFILLIGRVATLHSGEKVQQIYEKEQNLMSEKISLRGKMDDFMDELACVKDLDNMQLNRINNIRESIRFITPSANNEAKNYDNQFIQTLCDLNVLMRNVTLNKEKIIVEIDRLERIVSRRKQY